MARRVAGIVVASLVATGCATRPPAASAPEPVPFPVAAMTGHTVALYPLTALSADESLAWQDRIEPRSEALGRADSLIARFVGEEIPEVEWVLPSTLRAAARRAPGLLANPDRMATAMLRATALTEIPDPLRSELRNLTGVAADRYAAVPARLAFVADSAGTPHAELSLVLVDVRNGRVIWRTLARGEGREPWTALGRALQTLLPDRP